MKTISCILTILLVFLQIGFSQETTRHHSYNVLKSNTPALESKIEVATNGDTVLISKYVYQNPSNYSRQYFEKTYKGTPFFKNKWAPGTIYFEDGSVVNGTLAYNLTNNLVYYSLGNISDAMEAKPIGFTIDDNTFSKLNEKYENAYSGYFQMIFGGVKVDLFRQYSCIYRAQITGDRTGYEKEGGIYEGTYDKLSKLFLGWNNNIFELKSNNGIYKQFGDYKAAMEKFGKENKVNLKKEEDIIKLAVYFSQLVEEFDK
jgi:tetratricopeptide (TPR) repeat protein